MKISDSTVKDNINSGVLKRDIGMVYGTLSKNGKTRVDMVWLGQLPIHKGDITLSEKLEVETKEKEKLKEKINNLEKRVTVLTKTLESFLNDLENEMKEEF